ncbi:hypothetical protein SynBMKMC1_02362 [Synechococcus sp. BMK-MC-1]|nr:hypothetical protein SynBMKMC1_02362 [Synechococcus sp. BMK-MC-1]
MLGQGVGGTDNGQGKTKSSKGDARRKDVQFRTDNGYQQMGTASSQDKRKNENTTSYS